MKKFERSSGESIQKDSVPLQMKAGAEKDNYKGYKRNVVKMKSTRGLYGQIGLY